MKEKKLDDKVFKGLIVIIIIFFAGCSVKAAKRTQSKPVFYPAGQDAQISLQGEDCGC